MRAPIPVLLVLLRALPAAADEAAAKAHFEAGAALYAATRYEAALHEFEAAHATSPRAALVYNIARCLEHLERKGEAVAAYQRFLAEDPDSPAAEEVRDKILSLNLAPPSAVVPVSTPTVITKVEPTPPPTRLRRRRYLGPALLGGGALALAAIGGGLTGSAIADYNRLTSICAPDCPASVWQPLPARERAGEAILGIAAAAVVADVVWFIVIARRR